MMGRMRATATAVLLAVAAATAAGCGDEEAPAGPTHAAYVRQADGICRVENAKLAEISSRAFPDAPPTTPQLRTYVRRTFVPFIARELEDLRSLERPRADADELDAIYSMAEADLARVRADPTLLAADAATSPFADVNRRFAAFGLKVCGAG